MKPYATLLAISGSLLIIGAGCAQKPAAPSAPAPTPAAPEAAAPTATSDATISAIRGNLGAAGLMNYTETDENADAAKMKTGADIARTLKFKFSNAGGSVRLLVIVVKDPSKLAGVKAEVEQQYAMLQSLSSSTRIAWFPGDATHIVVANWKADDEAFAQQLVAAMGGAATAPAPTAAPQAAAPTQSVFKVGDSVMANWKGGSRWWAAKVTAVSGNQISVKYTSDNTTDTLNASAVAHLNQPNSTINVGDAVLAKWSDGNYYGAKVKAFDDTTVTVKWNDGSADSKLPYSSVELPGR